MVVIGVEEVVEGRVEVESRDEVVVGSRERVDDGRSELVVGGTIEEEGIGSELGSELVDGGGGGSEVEGEELGSGVEVGSGSGSEVGSGSSGSSDEDVGGAELEGCLVGSLVERASLDVGPGR